MWRKHSTCLAFLTISCLTSTVALVDLPNENLIGKSMTLSNDSLSVYPYGVNVTAVTVFDGTVCFKISNPQDNSWRVRLQFAGEKIMSSVYLQLPKDFKQYTDFLVLSWIITRNTDHWRELETLLQLRGYNTDTGRESQRICSLRPLTGSGFVFFCDYVASRFLELQVNTSQSGSLNNLGEYCIHLFHVPSPSFYKCYANTVFGTEGNLQFIKLSLQTDQMVYGIKLQFLTENGANMSESILDVVVNGTYDLTVRHKCGDKFPVLTDNNLLLYSCGYAGKFVWLLPRISNVTINECTIHLYKEPFCPIVRKNSRITVISYWPGGNTGKTVKVDCEDGYESSLNVKTNTLRCSSAGVWSTNFPSCLPVNCGKPTAPKDGSYHGFDFRFQRTITYVCNKGFLLKGSSVATCTAKSTWSVMSPTCEVINCGMPPSPTMTTFSGNDFDYGGRVTYSCDYGYCWTGSMSIRCSDSGRWEGMLPKCQRVDCGPVNQLPFGNVSVGYTYLGGRAIYSCDRGYEPHSTVRYCEYYIYRRPWNLCGVRWTRQAPVCRKKDCGPLSISYGTIKVLIEDGRHYLSKIKYVCHEGHKLTQGNESRTCEETGIWSDKQPSCTKVQCERPLRPRHGRVIGTTFTFASRIRFDCDTGFRISGPRNLRCTANATWDKEYPRCLVTQCLPITLLLNGKVLSMGYHVGGYVKFQCNEGHDLRGRERMDCVQDPSRLAQWKSSSLPKCEPKLCPHIAAPLNGSIHGTDFSFPHSVKFTCDYGRVITAGDAVRTCNASGQWTGVSPVCERVECQRPTAPQHGGVSNGPYLHLQRVNYWCDFEYALIGSRRSTCTASGRWSSSPPRCFDIRCPNLEPPLNGRIIISSTAVNGHAFYRCDIGSLMVANTSRRICQKISKYSTVGVWSGEQPYCEHVTCEVPSDPYNGKVIGDRFYYLNSIRYKCNIGYHKVAGDETRNCSELGDWTGNPVLCESMCDSLHHSCPKNHKCAVSTAGKVLCLCKSKDDCSSKRNLVCGSDGVTYLNECLLQSAACRLARSRVKRLFKASAGACTFNCSSCSYNADCINNTMCLCRTGYIGDGRVCCSQALESQITIEGASAVFNCKSRCDLLPSSFIWRRNERILRSEPTVNTILGGSFLVLQNVTKKLSGVYSCDMSVKGTAYNRSGVLEVIDISGIESNEDKCGSDCGISCARNLLVAGGDIADPAEFPWQAMLCLSRLGHYCGGVLVTKDCVVTAAHCVDQQTVKDNNITVCLGRHCGNCSEPDRGGRPQCFSPLSVAIHPLYDRYSFDNDVAIIRLSPGLKCDCSSVMPVCLPDDARDDDYIRAQMSGIVTGWGKVNATISRSRCLRKGQVHLTSRRMCQMRHEKYHISKSMRCATEYNGACEGDSGGPLVVQNLKNGGRYVLAGVVSWGIGCGNAKTLGVYTDVLHHLSWIKSKCGL